MPDRRLHSTLRFGQSTSYVGELVCWQTDTLAKWPVFDCSLAFFFAFSQSRVVTHPILTMVSRGKIAWQSPICIHICHHSYETNRPFPHSTSVRTNNSFRARLGWTFSYIYCIFVHPNLDSVPLFAGMRERSIDMSTEVRSLLFLRDGPLFV